MKSISLARLIAASACWLVIATAPAGAQQGDAEAGKFAFATCSGCHAIPGYSNAYPTYHVPRLAGQSPDYLVAALQAYKGGTRAHPTMQANAATLSDADMANLAAYLSAAEVDGASGPLKGDPAKGQEKAASCVACHGDGGAKPVAPDYPKLAGQYESYLLQALRDYKSRARDNAIMYGIVAALSEQDMADLAAYFSSIEPVVGVVSYSGQ